jgi:hypothetical protein
MNHATTVSDTKIVRRRKRGKWPQCMPLKSSGPSYRYVQRATF